MNVELLETRSTVDNSRLRFVNMDARDVGRRVKAAREARRMDQVDVADRARLSRAYISRLESGGIVNPKLLDLTAVAEAVGARLDDLLYDPPEFSAEDEAELAQALADPDMRIEFVTTMRDMRLQNWTADEKRFVLDAIRSARNLVNGRER